MSAPALTPSDALAEVLHRPASRMTRAERRVEALAGLAFLAATATLLAAFGTEGPKLGYDTLAAVALLAVAMNVRFDVGAGYTVPTQVAFVPLLFSAPPALVPPLVVAAVAAGSLPQVVSGQLRPSRLLLVLPNCWFAIGAATVVAALGEAPSPLALAGWVALAFAGQVTIDFLAAYARDALLGRSTLAESFAEARWVYAVDAALAPLGLLATWAPDGAFAGAVCLLPVVGLLGIFSRERRARMESLVELNRVYRGTALVLGGVIETDDGYTGEHSRSVVALSLEVARSLRLDSGRLRNLEFAALLHDVGKVAISKDIINKPGPLDPSEWAIVRRHTVDGQGMLDQIGGFMRQVGLIVRSHHEGFDGSGYPDGLAGADIPLEARIIACCDAYNAMTTTRPYRAAMPVGAAVAELRRHAGTQFDPQVVKALLRVIGADSASETLELAA